MKKSCIISICMLLCFGLVSCSESYSSNELRIATEMLDGDFVGGFSTSDYDGDVLELLHGYSTYEYDETGSMVLNEIPITDVKRSVDATTGDVRYDYTLRDDLKWSDGHALTAADYVFAVLFDSSLEWMEAGAMNADYDHLIGYMEYNSTSADEAVLPGVVLQDDTHFSILLDGGMLPYFNETILAMVTPRPMHIFTDGKGTILSDETGSRLSGVHMRDVAAYAKDNYRLEPKVSCGPYRFLSYENHVLKLERNPYFEGDFRHQKPQIEYITLKEMDTSLHVEALLHDEVDLISNIIEYEDVKKAQEAGNLIIEEFESSAYGNLAFACDFGPTSDVHVRRAISYALDKNELMEYALGGMAIPISSDYVPAQWMAKEKKAALEELDPYAFHQEKAMEELNQSSYVYESDGVTPFNSSKIQEDGSYLRYNAAKEPLIIRHLGSEGNAVTDSIQLQLSKNAAALGMKFIVDYGDFASITQNYYEGASLGDQRLYHSFNLASVLMPGYDPYYNFHGQFSGTPMNPSGIDDEELNRLLDEMEMSDIEDTDGYLDAWFAYEKRFNEILPVIPLYISQEHVLHTENVQHVKVNTMESYAHVICGIQMK